jgi:hypothetical protein
MKIKSFEKIREDFFVSFDISHTSVYQQQTSNIFIYNGEREREIWVKKKSKLLKDKHTYLFEDNNVEIVI